MRRSTLIAPVVAGLVLTAGVAAWAEDDDPGDDVPSAEQAEHAGRSGSGMSTAALPGPGGPAPAPVAASGRKWSDAATWGGKVPGAGDVATIPAGKTVVLDTVTPALNGVVVKGALVASGSGTVGITAGHIAVNGGRFQVGTAAAPFTGKATFTLTGTSTADSPDTPGMGDKGIAVNDGVLDLHGAPVARNWTQLAADSPAGDTTLTLAAAPGWKAGDRIVVATSSRDQNQADVATVQSVSGTTVTLAAPLKYRHLGTKQTVGGATVDTRAEVGLLSHNIVITGDDASVGAKVGAHTMIMGKSTARIEDVEVTKAGQLNQLGRYPIHFHMMGAHCTDCYVKSTSVHDTVQRGIVLHDSSGITVDQNVVYNTVGHNIMVETEGTTGNTLTDNLALVNKEPSPGFTEATLKTQNDKITANFWFKSSANKVSGNHAAGSFSNGYTYDDVGKQAIDFTKNVAHAAMTNESVQPGDFDVKAGLVISSQDSRVGVKDEISGMTVYQSGIGLWPEEGGGPWNLKQFTLAENDLQVENRGIGGISNYTDGTWVRVLPKGDAAHKDNRIVHVQYGGDVTLANPHIVGYSTAGLDGGDTNAATASVTVTNPSFSAGTPGWDVNDMLFVHFTDDKSVPKGAYVSKLLPFLGTKACTAGAGSLSGYVKCPKVYTFSELDFRALSNPGYTLVNKEDIVRSDGLKYHPPGYGTPDDESDTTKGVGQFGVSVSTDNGLTYALSQAHAGGTAVGLNSTFLDGGPAAQPVLSEKVTVEVAVPVTAAPTSVVRSNKVTPNGGTGAAPASAPSASGGTALKAVSSLEALRAAPLTSYYYDAAKKQVVVHASARWVLVK